MTDLAPTTTAPTTDHRSPSARQHRLVPAAAGTLVAPTLDLDTLVDIASGLARAEDLWRPHVAHDQLSRTSVRLVATAAYEVWLLGWTPGQSVALHDHGGANAAFVVLEGELDELTLGFAGITTRRLGAGGVGTVASGAVHDVLNRGTVDATSIHVYSDPLRTMTFYEPDGTPTHTEAVEEVPALVSSSSIARSLHPARSPRP